MILGLLAGNMLKSDVSGVQKVKQFSIVGASLVIIGLLIHFTGINPIVKRIWTPAWTIFSGGLCFLFLSLFYWIVDIADHKKWFQMLIIIGMNSIVAYILADGFGSFFVKSLYTHLGQNYDQVFGTAYASLVRGSLVLCIEFLILRWMYKRKLFIKI